MIRVDIVQPNGSLAQLDFTLARRWDIDIHEAHNIRSARFHDLYGFRLHLFTSASDLKLSPNFQFDFSASCA